MCATKTRRHKKNWVPWCLCGKITPLRASVPWRADGNLRLVEVGTIHPDDFEHFVHS
jgi:hypothetical protein